jgi:biofilm PGA synthesis N-glycosyltransferase PgaC
MSPLTYAVVTPAHNEAANLRRLADSMAAQTLAPLEWVIVDNGSTDATPSVAAEIERSLPWARLLTIPASRQAARGGPVVIAFHAGYAALLERADVVIKLDADTSFDDDFFERLVGAFALDERLGMAGGVCLEIDAKGEWRPDFVTRGHVRGATRAYRLACLADVLPLEERMGWDGIDELRARVKGWETRSIPDLYFRHHRPLGARERNWEKWVGQGDMSHFMGYRLSYLAGRTLYRTMQEPSAAGMLWGYVRAAVRRTPRYADPDVRAYLRTQQTLRALPDRIREALGLTDGRRLYSRLRERQH